MLAQTDFLAWPELIANGWGKDAVVCLFSRVDSTALLDQFRRACRSQGGRGNAVVGCCWPSVLGPLLSHSMASVVGPLLKGIDAVLVELPDLPEPGRSSAAGRLPPTWSKSASCKELPAKRYNVNPGAGPCARLRTFDGTCRTHHGHAHLPARRPGTGSPRRRPDRHRLSDGNGGRTPRRG